MKIFKRTCDEQIAALQAEVDDLKRIDAKGFSQKQSYDLGRRSQAEYTEDWRVLAGNAQAQVDSLSEVNRIAALEISTLQVEVDELAKLLTEGCNGFGSVLIQTSDMAGVSDWCKRVKEYLLITKHRSK